MLNLRFYTRSKTRVKRKYDFNTGDFDTGEGGEKNFPFKNFNEREKQRNPADFAVSSRLFIIVRLEDLDIVRSTSVHFVSRVYREEKEKRKRGRIRSVAFGCSSSMERRIIIRGIQPSPPSFLSSILSVGLGLPRVTLSSNGISDPSSSSSFDFTTRLLRILSTFAFTDTHAAPPPPPPPPPLPPPRSRPFSFSSLLSPSSSLFLLSRAHSTLRYVTQNVCISA